MADYQMNGTVYIRRFMRTNGINENEIERVAAACGVPRIHFGSRNGGQTPESFKRKISEAQAQALAVVLGTTVATLKNPGAGLEPILTQLP